MDPFPTIQSHCLAKEAAYEDYPWDHTAWKVKPSGKIFCIFAEQGVTVKSTLEKQAALIQHPNIEVAPYIGRHGWVMVHLRDEETLALVLDLIDESYQAVAPKRKPKQRA